METDGNEDNRSNFDIAVELRGVTKSFEGKKVHCGVDLQVREGEIMTLVGGSGQGKSVLLKEIIGLMKPDAGEILVNGREIAQLGERALMEIRKEVAMVFQGGALFDSLTVSENVIYGVHERDRRMKSAEAARIVAEKLEMVDMPGTEGLYPAELSGGMKKRVALARALAIEPRILLYDEPTTGLDPATVKRINAMIVKTRDRVGVTSIVVTHDMGSARAVTDRLALLSKGRIIAVSTWEEMERSADPRVRQFIEGESDT